MHDISNGIIYNKKFRTERRAVAGPIERAHRAQLYLAYEALNNFCEDTAPKQSRGKRQINRTSK